MRMSCLCRLFGVVALGAMALAAQACDQKSQAAPPAKAEKAAAKPADAKAAKADTPKTKVAKVVFVGLKDCCQCTGRRIKASWDVLQLALGGRTDVQVERFDIDVDEARADEMEKLGKVMVIPGLYFLSVDGKLVKLLQGEVTANQVAELL